MSGVSFADDRQCVCFGRLFPGTYFGTFSPQKAKTTKVAHELLGRGHAHHADHHAGEDPHNAKHITLGDSEFVPGRSGRLNPNTTCFGCQRRGHTASDCPGSLRRAQSFHPAAAARD